MIGQHMQSSLHSTRKQKKKLSEPIFPILVCTNIVKVYIKVRTHTCMGEYERKKKCLGECWVLLDCFHWLKDYVTWSSSPIFEHLKDYHNWLDFFMSAKEGCMHQQTYH